MVSLSFGPDLGIKLGKAGRTPLLAGPFHIVAKAVLRGMPHSTLTLNAFWSGCQDPFQYFKVSEQSRARDLETPTVLPLSLAARQMRRALSEHVVPCPLPEPSGLPRNWGTPFLGMATVNSGPWTEAQPGNRLSILARRGDTMRPCEP